jgi:hypothetical protein
VRALVPVRRPVSPTVKAGLTIRVAGGAGGRSWPEPMVSLLLPTALAVGSQVSEEVEPWRITEHPVIAMVALVLLGLASFARRRARLPILVIASGLIFVSYLNGRVEPVVARARHYAPMSPLGLVAAAEGLAVLHGFAVRFGVGRRSTRVAAACGLLILMACDVSSPWPYEAGRLTRLTMNNTTLLAVVEAVADSGDRSERVYIDSRIAGLGTLSGGRTLHHLRYAFGVVKQDNTVIDLERTRLPIGRSGNRSRRVVLRSGSVAAALAR